MKHDAKQYTKKNTQPKSNYVTYFNPFWRTNQMPSTCTNQQRKHIGIS